MKGFRSLLALIGALWASASTAHAQSITFDEAIGLAEDGPDVRALTRALELRRARDGDISDVTGWTQIWLQPGWRIFDEQDRGYEAQYYVTHSWSLSDLANLQRTTASDERDVLAIDARRAALARRLESARAWLELHTAERLLVVAVQLAAQADSDAAAIERARVVGVRTVADVAEAQLWRSEIAMLALSLEERHAEARIALARALAGDREPIGLATAGAVPTPPLPEQDALRDALNDFDALPEVELRRLAAVAARAHAEEVHAGFAPQLQIGVQLQNEAPSGFTVFGIAALTFGVADLGARQHAQMLGEAELLEAGIEVVRNEARAEIASVLHDVEHQRERAELMRSRLMPALLALVESREAAISTGIGTIFELMIARRRLGEAQIGEVDADGARAMAEVQAWLLLAELERARAGGAR